MKSVYCVLCDVKRPIRDTTGFGTCIRLKYNLIIMRGKGVFYQLSSLATKIAGRPDLVYDTLNTEPQLLSPSQTVGEQVLYNSCTHSCRLTAQQPRNELPAGCEPWISRSRGGYLNHHRRSRWPAQNVRWFFSKFDTLSHAIGHALPPNITHEFSHVLCKRMENYSLITIATCP
jgi:hypothetical protein